MILHGDCLNKLKTLKPNSVDSIVTDPPYGLSFMGKKWDYDVPSVEIWRECLRVLKPGGHLLSFAGTRTYHRMACNIEDAGFEIRDQIMWLYGSGFPKSHDISKAIDKAAGAEREVVGKAKGAGTKDPTSFGNGHNQEFNLTAPATEAAKQWQGWGTALKPANEPIVVARKPLEAGLTVAANVLKYGTGALNIDASRVELAASEDVEKLNARSGGKRGFSKQYVAGENDGNLSAGCDLSKGRWPANVLLDEEAAAALDEQTGDLGKSSGGGLKNADKFGGGYAAVGEKTIGFGDTGGASRFFYVAKASKKERSAGSEVPNTHPTVKPVKLMEYLIKLVTPANGIVLDPFMGSGTTGVAAKKLGFSFVGIEREAEYAAIAEKRIEAVA